MLKPSDNPLIIWPQDSSVSEFPGQWWVAHTKSRNEKALAKELAGRDISYFLPMSWKVSRTRGRKIRSLLPIFPSYLFFCGTEINRLDVLRTNRTANIIEVNDQSQFVRELLSIEQVLAAGAALAPHKYVQKGQICRVISGPLEGMKGFAIEIKGTTRLVLQIDMLGQAASVEVDTEMIELVDDTQ